MPINRTVARSSLHPLGEGPLVIGTLSSLAKDFPATEWKQQCDLVEMRIDLIGPETTWLEVCKDLEKQVAPVIVTIRFSSQGGRWSRPDEERLPAFRSALENLAAVDIEYTSKIRSAVCEIAREHGKTCIISHHDFAKTPGVFELKSVISEAQRDASIVKIATMIKDRSDIETLRSLLSEQWSVPLCLMGMGALATETRVILPALGSYMTYGYLDKPVAPGQPAARELMQQLRQKVR